MMFISVLGLIHDDSLRIVFGEQQVASSSKLYGEVTQHTADKLLFCCCLLAHYWDPDA